MTGRFVILSLPSRGWRTALTVLFAVLVFLGHDAFNEEVVAESDALFEQKLIDLLERRPELVVEALRRYETIQTARQEEEKQLTLTKFEQAVQQNPNLPAIGPPPSEASVILVEFFDYQCGFCKRLFAHLLTLHENHPDIRIVFMDFPVLGPQSTLAARAGLAAVHQQAYFPFHKAMVESRGRLSEEKIFAIAEDIDLDVDKLKEDMADPAIDALIEANLGLASKLGIRGTPALIAGDVLVPGYIEYDELERLVGIL